MTSQAPENGPVVPEMVASREAALLNGKAHEDRGPHGSCCPVPHTQPGCGQSRLSISVFWAMDGWMDGWRGVSAQAMNEWMR